MGCCRHVAYCRIARAVLVCSGSVRGSGTGNAESSCGAYGHLRLIAAPPSCRRDAPNAPDGTILANGCGLLSSEACSAARCFGSNAQERSGPGRTVRSNHDSAAAVEVRLQVTFPRPYRRQGVSCGDHHMPPTRPVRARKA